jgi:glutamate 5-kinase
VAPARAWARGGMITKVLAAKRAAGSGASTVIAWGREPDVLVRLAQGEAIGSLFVAGTAKLTARKQWMADHLQLRGAVVIDDGAVVEAARRRQEPAAHRHDRGGGRVLQRGDVIAVRNSQGQDVARGLANYASSEARLLARKAVIRDRGGPGLHQRARDDPPRQPRAGLSQLGLGHLDVQPLHRIQRRCRRRRLGRASRPLSSSCRLRA